MSEKESKKNKEAPVVSVYSLIRNDIWSAHNEFTTEYGVICGLRDMDREGSKEYKEARSRAIAFSVQFYYKIFNNFDDTFKRIKERNKLEYSEERIKTHGDDVDNYHYLMGKIIQGDKDKKGNTIKFKPTYPHLGFIGLFITKFLRESGISHIEGRFEKDERSEFGYGA